MTLRPELESLPLGAIIMIIDAWIIEAWLTLFFFLEKGDSQAVFSVLWDLSKQCACGLMQGTICALACLVPAISGIGQANLGIKPNQSYIKHTPYLLHYLSGPFNT